VVEYTHFDALKQFTNADWVPQTMQSRANHDADNQLILTQFAFMKRDIAINYFTGSFPADSYETDRKIFLGNNEYGSWSNPLSLQNQSLSNSEANRGDNIAAILYPMGTLQPGESRTLITQLGQTDRIVSVEADIQSFRQPQTVENALFELKQFWDDYLSHLQVNTPDQMFNTLINVHNARQCYITKNWSRYLSLYQLGLGARGIGTRDSSQDILGVVHAVPQEAKSLLQQLISVQSRNGYAYHQFYPLTMEANMGDSAGEEGRPKYYSDDFLWTVQAIAAYHKETGDMAFLDEVIPFYEKAANEQPLEHGTVREHIDRGINFSLHDTGQHGLCLLGFADWNDTINLPSGAESAFTTCLLGVALKERITIADLENDQATLQTLEEKYQRLKETFNNAAWTGDWYLSYFDEQGNPLGSPDNEFGRIYVYGQTWPILAGFADAEKARKSLDAIHRFLVTEHGIKLSTPGYNGFDPHVGGISTYPPGTKENCGIFMHVNPWVIIAETITGNTQRAYAYHQSTNPALKNDIIDCYECEPYVYAQNILSDEHPQFGLARNSWLSGTAAWMYVAATQHILGIQPTYQGLSIKPHLPEQWGKVTVTRKFRGVDYHITIAKHQEKQNTVQLTVDGELIAGDTIPVFTEGSHYIEAWL
jgi:cellobiose phosphorylase